MSSPRFMDFRVDEALAGQRLDRVLGQQGGCSPRQARQLIDAGAVFVNDRRLDRRAQVLAAGDRVRTPLELPPEPAVDLRPRLLHRDGDLLVVDKPAGVPSAPTPLGARGSLPELLRKQLRLPEAPRVVHRLDSAVSGVMALALNRAGSRRLAGWFESGRATKRYRTVVHGLPYAPAGELRWPLERDPARKGRMRVSSRGRPARTGYRVLGGLPGCPEAVAVALRLYTGRTHQLRVHLRTLGVPILGDRWYGGPKRLRDANGAWRQVTRLCLHAHQLEVRSPDGTSPPVIFEAPLPDFAAALVPSAPRRR